MEEQVLVKVDEVERELAESAVATICLEAAHAIERLLSPGTFTEHEWCLGGRSSGAQWPPTGLVAARRGRQAQPVAPAPREFADARN